jgi:hypothetical protein
LTGTGRTVAAMALARSRKKTSSEMSWMIRFSTLRGTSRPNVGRLTKRLAHEAQQILRGQYLANDRRGFRPYPSTSKIRYQAGSIYTRLKVHSASKRGDHVRVAREGGARVLLQLVQALVGPLLEKIPLSIRDGPAHGQRRPRQGEHELCGRRQGVRAVSAQGTRAPF